MPMSPWITALLVLGAAVLGYVVALVRERRTAGDALAAARAERDAARADAARLPDLLERAQRAEDQAAQATVRMQETLASAAAEGATLAATRESLRNATSARDSDAAAIDSLRAQVAELSAQLARATADRDAIAAAHQQTKAFLDEAQTRMRSVFIEAASKVFDEKAIALDEKIKASGQQSRESLEATLKPISERVGHFQQRIEEFTAVHARDQARFTGTIDTLQKLNQDMADATNSLSRALKGNAKTRGDWGEMILDTVLKASGLVEGSNYSRQAQATDEESGKRRSPDVIVNLPDGRRVVVDSKVNLVAWTEANNAETPAAYEDAMIRHTAALRQHVRDLAEKNYPRVVGKDTLDLTVMFVPIEGALSAALSTNADIQDEALSRRVVFASPNTLMAMLRVVERLWVRDRLQRQVELIGTEAGKMLDALIDFLEDFRAIDAQLRRTQDAFDKANRRLDDSDRSVVRRARRLVEAGAKGRKAVPELLRPLGDGPAGLALGEAADGEGDKSGGDAGEGDAGEGEGDAGDATRDDAETA